MFQGFSKEGLQFLQKLKRNNRREWFQPRKEIYETTVKAPMVELVEQINAALLKFAPAHVNDPKKAIYRIYRDTRFSADKTPYKTHIAAVFPPRGGPREASAGFYFHVSDSQVGIAGGAYMPGPEQLLAIRTWLAENHGEFLKAVRKVERTMGKLQGSSLQRPPKGFAADHPAIDLLKQKQWVFWASLDLKIAESPKVADELIKRFRAMAPVIAILNRASVGRPFRPPPFQAAR
jgi:uncharacterized protein (TIGR02453 family)